MAEIYDSALHSVLRGHVWLGLSFFDSTGSNTSRYLASVAHNLKDRKPATLLSPLWLQAPRRPNGGLQPVSCHGRLPDLQTFRWLAAATMFGSNLFIVAVSWKPSVTSGCGKTGCVVKLNRLLEHSMHRRRSMKKLQLLVEITSTRKNSIPP